MSTSAQTSSNCRHVGSRNVERLDEFLSTAPRTIRWAVELRERSWLHDDVFGVLRRHNAALCIHDLLERHPFELTADWTYVRFHGPDAIEHPYHGSYGEAQLGRWVDRLGPVLDGGRDVFVYFNNDWYGHAVTDAAFLRDGTHNANLDPKLSRGMDSQSNLMKPPPTVSVEIDQAGPEDRRQRVLSHPVAWLRTVSTM